MVKPYYDDGKGISIYHGDCRDILPTLPKADLCLTDPPYGMNYQPKRHPGGKWLISHTEKIFGDDSTPDVSILAGVSNKLIVWGGNWLCYSFPISGGWLIWDKRRLGSVNPDFVASDCELAWSNIFGRTKIFSHLWAGLTRDSEIGQHFHPTQKPIALMKWCLSFAPGAKTVIDPYMGSGTTLRACKDLGKFCIGIEREEKYCEIAALRLSQEVLDLTT